MIGMNRETGRQLTGWDHVVQSLQVIFTTRFHERVMRRWFGSLIPHMLGEPMIERTMLKFFYSVAVAIELWEPRFKIIKININKANRDGEVSFRIDGEYFPNATMQDFQTRVNRSLIMIARQSGLVVGPFDGAV